MPVPITVNDSGIVVHVVKTQFALGEEVLNHSAIALEREGHLHYVIIVEHRHLPSAGFWR